MNENYYRELINTVSRNDKGMWGKYDADSNEGFEDFAKLWNILNDEDADVSPKTYFEAIDLCMDSFFGTIQNPVPVWENVANHYESALRGGYSSFVNEFEKYLSQIENSILDLSNFYRLIHLAIESGDLHMTRLLFNHSQTIAECWDMLREMYEKYPEMAAYYEIFGDLTYDWLPEKDPEFRRAIERLYLSFGNLPDMEKLQDYHNRFCK